MPLRPCKVRATAVSLLVLAALGFTAVPPREQAETKERADLVVRGGTIVTMDGQRRVVEDGAIAVNHQAIVMVGPRIQCQRHRGIVNCHADTGAWDVDAAFRRSGTHAGGLGDENQGMRKRRDPERFRRMSLARARRDAAKTSEIEAQHAQINERQAMTEREILAGIVSNQEHFRPPTLPG